MNRIYNLKRQELDERDYTLKGVLDVHPKVKLPVSVDLRSKCPPVYDQGDLGSCTANAGVAARQMLNYLSIPLSRLFLYYNERLLEGTTNKDSGAQMRTICKAMINYGICEEKLFPYNITKFKIKPSVVEYKNGLIYAPKTYHVVVNIGDIKNILALKSQPVMIGMDIYESFESDKVSENGIVPIPKKSEQFLGGHAVLVVGYDDRKKWFIVRNSWGSGWGDKGYFYLPYDYFIKEYAFDFWILN